MSLGRIEKSNAFCCLWMEYWAKVCYRRSLLIGSLAFLDSVTHVNHSPKILNKKFREEGTRAFYVARPAGCGADVPDVSASAGAASPCSPPRPPPPHSRWAARSAVRRRPACDQATPILLRNVPGAQEERRCGSLSHREAVKCLPQVKSVLGAWRRQGARELGGRRLPGERPSAPKLPGRRRERAPGSPLPLTRRESGPCFRGYVAVLS